MKIIQPIKTVPIKKVCHLHDALIISNGSFEPSMAA